MPPKKIKFNIKKKAMPKTTDPKSALPPLPPAKKKNKKFNVKKKASTPSVPAKKPVPDKWFLSDDEDYVDGEIVKIGSIIQVQDRDKYFG